VPILHVSSRQLHGNADDGNHADSVGILLGWKNAAGLPRGWKKSRNEYAFYYNAATAVYPVATRN